MMREPSSCDYIYVDDNNGVHVLVPIVGGDLIGTDNTCQMKSELGVFLEGKAAELGRQSYAYPYTRLPDIPAKPNIKSILESYAEALRADIDELAHSAECAKLRQLKQERLVQINGYIEIASYIRNTHIDKYDLFKDMTNRCKNNGVAIRLSPEIQDNSTSLAQPVFSFARNGEYVTSCFRGHLLGAFSKLSNAKKDVFNNVLMDIVKQIPPHLKEAALLEHIQTHLPAILAAHGKGAVDLTISSDAQTLNYDYLHNTLGIADAETTPRDMAQMALKSCTSDNYWLDDSPFSGKQTAEQASIKTQFFIAQACAYAYAHGFSDKGNAGARIEGNSSLQTLFSQAVITAYKKGASVELALLDVLDNNHKALGLKKAFTQAQREDLVKLFYINFKTISGSPHFDEFLLFFPDAPGIMVNHHNRLSMHIVDALSGMAETRFNYSDRKAYKKHKTDWLAERHRDFQDIQSKKLGFSNQNHLGDLPEIDNPEPLAPLIEQLAIIDSTSFQDKHSISDIRQHFTQINSDIDKIAQGRVIRAEQLALRTACHKKRGEIQAVRDLAIRQLEQALLQAEKERVNRKIGNLDAFSSDCAKRFESITALSHLADVQSELLTLVPTDEEIELFNGDEQNQVIMAADEMKAIVFSLETQRREELDPIIGLQREIQAFDITSLLLCQVEMVDDVKEVLQGQLAIFEEQAKDLGAHGLIQELNLIRHQMDNLIEWRGCSFEKPILTVEESQWLQAQVNALDEIKFELDVAETIGNLSEQARNQLFSTKLAEANGALDAMFQQAKLQKPDMDLSYLEDEIIFKKTMYASAVEESKKILIEQARLKAEKTQLSEAIQKISPITIQLADTAIGFLNAKNMLLNNLDDLEIHIKNFPSEQQLEFSGLLDTKRAEIEAAIHSAEKGGKIADEMKNVEQRYGAVFGVMHAQQQKISAQSTSVWYGFFNNKSSHKVDAINAEINKIAQQCCANMECDLSKIKNTFEFKVALLDAWDDKNSALYQALNSKRLSVFGHSLTLFSGQSWSDCIDGDSATVKAIKEVDPAEQVLHVAAIL